MLAWVIIAIKYKSLIPYINKKKKKLKMIVDDDYEEEECASGTCASKRVHERRVMFNDMM